MSDLYVMDNSSDGYNPEMQELHKHNANMLSDIIDEIAYPSVDIVGEEANEAAWLVIQHSIGQPIFMRMCLGLLEKAVSDSGANPKHMAYLTDRIAVLEGRLQCYGTQFDWDENGDLNPNPIDELSKVNDRRKSVGLNTIEVQIDLMREQARKEKQSPPKDYIKGNSNF